MQVCTPPCVPSPPSSLQSQTDSPVRVSSSDLLDDALQVVALPLKLLTGGLYRLLRLQDGKHVAAIQHTGSVHKASIDGIEVTVIEFSNRGTLVRGGRGITHAHLKIVDVRFDSLVEHLLR